MNLRFIVMLLAFAAGLISGAAVTRNYYRAQIAEVQLSEQLAASLRVGKTQSLVADLERRLIAFDKALHHSEEGRRDALRQVTHGRVCLSVDAVRLLNSPLNALLPRETIAPAFATDANRSATDQDVGEWVIHAREQYGLCAVRLNTLIDFEEQKP